MADFSTLSPTNSANETQLLPTTVDEPLEENPTSPLSSPIHRSFSESRVTRRTTRSPRANPYLSANTTGGTSNQARRRTDVRRWGWLSTTLNAWRDEEGIHTTGEPMDISPYTQEPMHHTVPVLTARLYRQENRLDEIQMEQLETRDNWMELAQGRVAQMYLDQEDISETVNRTHEQIEETREDITVLHFRLEQCEHRLREVVHYNRMLEQRLTAAEENAQQAGRLAATVDHLITLLPQMNLHRD